MVLSQTIVRIICDDWSPAATDIGEAGQSLDDGSYTLLLHIRPDLAHAADGNIDEPRMPFAQLRGPQAETPAMPGRKFCTSIGLGGELAQDFDQTRALCRSPAIAYRDSTR